MQDTIRALLSEKIFYLFLIVGLGTLIGRIEYRGFSLGAVGVLFVGMVFGHYGIAVDTTIRDIGLLLFVYAVGLQVGPRFFRLLANKGWEFALAGVFTVSVAAAVLIAFHYIFKLSPDLTVGIYTGAVTNTPALAAAMDLFKTINPSANAGNISVGYGLAYPFSMFGTVLMIKFLPKILKRNAKDEADKWETEGESMRQALQVGHYTVNNPAADGKMIAEINVNRMVEATASRVRRGNTELPIGPKTVIHIGDVVTVVGPEQELEKFSVLLGPQTEQPSEIDSDLISHDVTVTAVSVEGRTLKSLKFWEKCGVVITRVWRNGSEYTPTGRFALEVGDVVRAVGASEDIEKFTEWVGAEEKRLSETNLVSFALGLALGIALGSITLHLPTGHLKIGMATGAFIVALLLGHLNRVGPISVYCPPAANNLARELGLMLFLAGAGTTAGAKFVEVMHSGGLLLIGIGAIVTISAWLAAIVYLHYFRKQNLLGTMGSIAAAMTNPPSLTAASSHTESDLVALSYAATYPVAMLTKVVIAQILLSVLAR